MSHTLAFQRNSVCDALSLYVRYMSTSFITNTLTILFDMTAFLSRYLHSGWHCFRSLTPRRLICYWSNSVMDRVLCSSQIHTHLTFSYTQLPKQPPRLGLIFVRIDLHIKEWIRVSCTHAPNGAWCRWVRECDCDCTHSMVMHVCSVLDHTCGFAHARRSVVLDMITRVGDTCCCVY